MQRIQNEKSVEWSYWREFNEHSRAKKMNYKRNRIQQKVPRTSKVRILFYYVA